MSDVPSTIRVLVAEDNALERSTLVDLLVVLGHMVVAEVESGAEAIEKARNILVASSPARMSSDSPRGRVAAGRKLCGGLYAHRGG